MNTNARQPLHIWIFNDASIASLLQPDPPLWPGFKPAIIAEVSDRPALAYSLDLETPAAYPGIAGLLGPSTAPADLAVRLPRLQIPAILAPAQSLNASVWLAALRRLAHDPRITGPRIVLVDAALAPSLAPVLALADRIGLAWDLSTPPGAPLQALMQVLAQDGILRPETWAGIAAYFSADHVPAADELSSAQTTLAALPGGRLLPALAPLV
jgi:hypothetical protein